MNKKTMNLKFINIVDPTFSKNNLGRSISKLNSSRIKYGMKVQMKRMSRLYSEANDLDIMNKITGATNSLKSGGEYLLKGLLEMFQVTFECIGVQPAMSLIMP